MNSQQEQQSLPILPATSAFHKARRHYDAITQHFRAIGNLCQQRETLMGLVTAARKEGSIHHHVGGSRGDCAVSAEVPLSCSGMIDHQHLTVDVPLRCSRSSALGVLCFFAGGGSSSPPPPSPSPSVGWGSVDSLYVAMGLMGSLTKDVDALVGECHQLSTKFDEEVAKFGVEIEASNVIVGLGVGGDGELLYGGYSEGDNDSSPGDEDNVESPPIMKKARMEFTPDLDDISPSEVMRAAVAAYKALLITGSMLRRVVLHTMRKDLETVGGGGGIDAVGMYEAVVPSEERYLIGDITRAVRGQFATLLHQQISAAATTFDDTLDGSAHDNAVVMSLLSSYVGKYSRICVATTLPANQLSEAFLDVADALEVRWVCDGLAYNYLRPTAV